MKKIAIIVPALEKNRFSSEGDLSKFGDMTLLEWKINQVKAFRDIANIYITTPSEKIFNEYKNQFNVIKRNSLDYIIGLEETLSEVEEEIVLWTNCNSPFVSERIYKNAIDCFNNLDKVKYDTLISAYIMKDYFIFKDSPLNFDIKIHQSRVDIEPLHKVTNGIFIGYKNNLIKNKNLFGKKNFLFEIDKMESYEINDIEDHIIANDLIALFIKKEMLGE